MPPSRANSTKLVAAAGLLRMDCCRAASVGGAAAPVKAMTVIMSESAIDLFIRKFLSQTTHVRVFRVLVDLSTAAILSSFFAIVVLNWKSGRAELAYGRNKCSAAGGC